MTGEFPAQRASNVEMFPFDDVIVGINGIGMEEHLQCECSINSYQINTQVQLNH